MNPEEVRVAWQVQPAQLEPLTASLLRRTTRTHAATLRIKGLSSLVMGSAFTLFFAALAWGSESWLCKIGCALMACGHFYAVSHMARVTWLPSSSAPDLGSCVGVYRSNLTRTLACLEGHLRAMGPLIAGLVLAWIGWVVSSPQQWLEAAGVALFFGFGVHYTSWRALHQNRAAILKELELLPSVDQNS